MERRPSISLASLDFVLDELEWPATDEAGKQRKRLLRLRAALTKETR